MHRFGSGKRIAAMRAGSVRGRKIAVGVAARSLSGVHDSLARIGRMLVALRPV